MGIEEYYKRLREHDWFYAYSDCPETYKKGLKEQTELVAATNLSVYHKKLYEDYSFYVNNPGSLEPCIN